MGSSLLVGDLHLTTNPRDEYRWDIFSIITDTVGKFDCSEIIFLGDLTDAGDRHSAELVNRIADEVNLLRGHVAAIHAIRGNHDGNNPQRPYFYWLRHLSGVYFYAQPGELSGHHRWLALPHSRNPLAEWQKIDQQQYDVAFAHVTVRGAESENKQELESEIGCSWFAKRGLRVYAGDVHVPQKIGPVVYVGAPYPIHFGDDFEPRLLVLDGKKEQSVPVPQLMRRLLLDVSQPDELEPMLRENDQLKVRLHLSVEDLHLWHAQRKAIQTLAKVAGVDLVSVELIREGEMQKTQKVQARSQKQILQEYWQRSGLTDKKLLELGQRLIG